jgi:hypothetical protein
MAIEHHVFVVGLYMRTIVDCSLSFLFFVFFFSYFLVGCGCVVFIFIVLSAFLFNILELFICISFYVRHAMFIYNIKI